MDRTKAIGVAARAGLKEAGEIIGRKRGVICNHCGVKYAAERRKLANRLPFDSSAHHLPEETLCTIPA
jgi:hypothetical protein